MSTANGNENAPAETTTKTRKKPGPNPGEGGAPVKPESERKKNNVMVRMTDELHELLKVAAETKGTSKADMLRLALQFYCEQEGIHLGDEG